MPQFETNSERRRTQRSAQWILLTVIAVLASCAGFRAHRWDRRYGEAQPLNRTTASVPDGAVDYWQDVRPILASRCVVCHGCYDAPCQVKLGSPEGIDRGATDQRVYQAARLREADPTRLFEDAATTMQWRDKGFHPILNERRQSSAANRDAGLIARLLDLKAAHPVTPGALLPKDVDISLQRDQKCPTIEEVEKHERKHPDWGMPFGTTGISQTEHQVLVRWIEEGARHTALPAPSGGTSSEIERWEDYFNGDSTKAQLVSRYMYEHLFLAHLYFEAQSDSVDTEFFELVRSKTPPGQPIQRIATRRPYDDPGVPRPYYRLRPVHESLVAKLHLPYALSDARMDRWTALFDDADFEVTELPSYDPKVASNPFVAFEALPPTARYRFMLEEAQYTIMGFIKGAVCRGPIALNVIDDHFFVFFVDPEVQEEFDVAGLLRRKAKALRMPATSGSNAAPMVTWARNATRQKEYMEAKRATLREAFAGPRQVTLDTLWDGDGTNPNAALTVFRHLDSASVVRGMVGKQPKTTWVIGYPLLERIHYLLVAGFDVYGNVGHQLTTRTYMDFLRMEAEFSFLAFLPVTAREKERDLWYRKTNERINSEIVGEISDMDVDSGIAFLTPAPKLELYSMLRNRFAGLSERRYNVETATLRAQTLDALERLRKIQGHTASRMPEVSFLLVPDAPPEDQVFTILRNSAHLNIASPLHEDKRRAPGEDTLTVARGFIGTYPNALYVVPQRQLGAFVDAAGRVTDEKSYAELQVRFGIRRTHPEFWSTLDRLHELYRERQPIEAGLFDVSRVENR